MGRYIDENTITDVVEVFNQLENKDQVELFRFFERMYKRSDADVYPLDEIMYILNKLVFEDQQEVVQFFMDLYDGDVDFKKTRKEEIPWNLD